jgi:hypothetical protein
MVDAGRSWVGPANPGSDPGRLGHEAVTALSPDTTSADPACAHRAPARPVYETASGRDTAQSMIHRIAVLLRSGIAAWIEALILLYAGSITRWVLRERARLSAACGTMPSEGDASPPPIILCLECQAALVDAAARETCAFFTRMRVTAVVET